MSGFDGPPFKDNIGFGDTFARDDRDFLATILRPPEGYGPAGRSTPAFACSYGCGRRIFTDLIWII
jgi:hypothetical protein